jgi:hypothetical protein
VTERGDQIQKLLGSLAKHADLIAQAFDGAISGGDKQRNAGIEALFGLSILTPYDEDEYRLNPRLREFLADYFASYQAFQALRRVTGTMRQAREQWGELRRLKTSGISRDAARLQAALDESVVEIAYSIEHNLSMLHSLLSTQYGNVEDLSSKLSQNRYYARQVVQFLGDVESIDAFVERVGDEAIASGMLDVRQMVTRRLGAKRLAWTSQIKDAQAIISKRLFEAKLMEERLKRLARFSLWLTRHRTADGWELPVDNAIDATLVRPQSVKVRPQPDVSDTDPVVWDAMVAAASRMPPKTTTTRQERDPGPQMMVGGDEEPVAEVLTPEQLAIERLAAEVRRSDAPASLLAWKTRQPELSHLSDETWLMFSSTQLKGMKYRVDFLADLQLDPFPINDAFFDIEVRRPHSAAALLSPPV